MNRLLMLVVLLLVWFSSSLAQDKTFGMLNKYDAMKMDKTTAVLCAVVVPGGGAIYTQNYIYAPSYVLWYAGLGYLTYVIHTTRHDRWEAVPIVAMVLVKIEEIVWTVEKVDSYNYQIKRYFSIEAKLSVQPGFKIQYNF